MSIILLITIIMRIHINWCILNPREKDLGYETTLLSKSYLDSELLRRSHLHSLWPRCKVCSNEYIYLSQYTVCDLGDIWPSLPVHLKQRNKAVWNIWKSIYFNINNLCTHVISLLQSQLSFFFPACGVALAVGPYAKKILHCHNHLYFCR